MAEAPMDGPRKNPLGTPTAARRTVIGSSGSVFSGTKIKHLKKDDGVPLWRRDIQYDLLRCIFDDQTRCFHRESDNSAGHTFAEVYIDTIARSSKTSKILREKLLMNHESAAGVAMICLLVNIGRMNTTLNCMSFSQILMEIDSVFLEMRAQLRTFHPIPALQVGRDSQSCRQLQDAPRLKSILKGASDDAATPSTMETLRALPVPRTNPVHLIFLLSQIAPQITDLHFNQPNDFFDLIMRTTLSSKSRAKAFLWLMWWYMESDLSETAAQHNPFGPGSKPDGGHGAPIKVPAFEHLTESQAEGENIDTPAELEYGQQKELERRRLLEHDELTGRRSKKGAPDDASILASDGDLGRSPSPSTAHLRPPSIVNKLDPNTPLKFEHDPQPLLTSLPKHLQTNGSAMRRPKFDAHNSKAGGVQRKAKVDKLLRRQLTLHQYRVRKVQAASNRSFGMMIMNRIRDLDDAYDTEDETSWGPGGLVPNSNDLDDFGEEACRHSKAIHRVLRRLYRQDEGKAPPMLGFRTHAPSKRRGEPPLIKKKRPAPDTGKPVSKKPKLSVAAVETDMVPSDNDSLSSAATEDVGDETRIDDGHDPGQVY